MQPPELQSDRYSKTCVKRSLSKRPHIGFQDQLSLNAGQKYCRMLQGGSILQSFIKLPFVIKIFVLSIFSGRFTQVLLYMTCLLSISDFVLVQRCHIFICTASLCV